MTNLTTSAARTTRLTTLCSAASLLCTAASAEPLPGFTPNYPAGWTTAAAASCLNKLATVKFDVAESLPPGSKIKFRTVQVGAAICNETITITKGWTNAACRIDFSGLQPKAKPGYVYGASIAWPQHAQSVFTIYGNSAKNTKQLVMYSLQNSAGAQLQNLDNVFSIGNLELMRAAKIIAPADYKSLKSWQKFGETHSCPASAAEKPSAMNPDTPDWQIFVPEDFAANGAFTRPAPRLG